MPDLVIIGSGPAGISAALYAARAGINTTIISNGNSAISKAHLIENYYGFAFPISGKELEASGIQGAKNVGAKVVEKEVVSVSYEDKFVIKTTDSVLKADSVILATGASRATLNIKNLENFEGKGVSYCAVCDAFFYRNKEVFVLGNSEYALNEAKELLGVVKKVTVLTNGKEPTVEFPESVSVITENIILVSGDERFEYVQLENGEKLYANGIFIAVGVAGSSQLARKIGAALDNNKILVDEKMHTNIPLLFACGDCTGGMLQISKAVYEGAVAGSEAAKLLKKLQ